MRNTISIIITTYNGAKYLREQLDSVYAQTLLANEVIAIDDCSTDSTLEILEEYHKKYGLIYFKNEVNLGVNANFEKGIKLCTGDYICCCDQDDVWFPEKNEILYRKMQEIENDGPCVVSSRNTFVDAKLNIKHDTELKKDTCDYRDTILFHLSQGASMMLNRKCLEYIFPFPDKETGICYDFHIGYIVAMAGKKYDLKQSLMYYRVHENNITASFGKKSEHFVLRKNRPTSVVAEHYIRTFKYANKGYPILFPKDRINYVNRIIRLAEESNFFHVIGLLLTTFHIPLSSRFHSALRAFANIFLK